MSTKSSNKSPSPSSVSGSSPAGFLQLSLDFSGSYPDSFTIDSSLLSESPLAHSAADGARGRGSGAITFICIGRGSGFRRYISSDGYPWTLWLKSMRLERGRIFDNGSPALLHFGRNNRIYKKMSMNGKNVYIHRVVAQFFLNGGEPIPPGMEVDHLDGNKMNNAVINLEITTHEENHRRCIVKHGWKHMTAHQRKLAKEQRLRHKARYHALRAAQASQQSTTRQSTQSVPSPSL